MDDFDRLLRELHSRGMKLMMDLVLNHTSHKHPWFIDREARRTIPSVTIIYGAKAKTAAPRTTGNPRVYLERQIYVLQKSCQAG